MQTRVSTKGQVVIPGVLRRKLGIRPGDPLEIAVEESRIVLTVQRPSRPAAKMITDPETGLPVFFMEGDNVPVLTSQEVEDMLAELP